MAAVAPRPLAVAIAGALLGAAAALAWVLDTAAVAAVAALALASIAGWALWRVGDQEREARLRSQGEEERFRAVLEGAPDAIVCVDSQGRIVYVNSQAERLFGYGRDELVAKTIEALVPARYRADHVALRDRYLLDPEMRPIGVGREVFALRRDGREVPVEITLNPVPTRDGPLVVSVVRDISERRRGELELQRSLAELESFAYVASHDLQEPLRMVVSYLELFARRYRGHVDAEADEYIGYAVEGAARMQRLIADLLAYSRVHRESRDLGTVHLEQAFASAVANLRAVVQESAAEITHDPLPALAADPTEMVQVFQNLLSNALKFHGEQKPKIHVSAVQQSGVWELCVRDNGIGIAREHLQRIFVIFQRLHAGSQYPGTGIGLAICKKIVESRGGRIWAESEPGAGTSVYFTLPAEVEA